MNRSPMRRALSAALVVLTVGFSVVVAGPQASSAVPLAPIAVPDTAEVDAFYSAEADLDTKTPHTVSIDVLANDSDPDGAGPDVYADMDITRIVDGPSKGTVDCGALPGDGPCLFTPRNGVSGTDRFNYEVVDASGSKFVATVTVSIHGNGRPYTYAHEELYPYGRPAGTPIEFSLTNNSDPNGDGLVYRTTLIEGPHYGGISVALTSDGTYTWTVTDDSFARTEWFEYEVCDDHALVVPDSETGVDDGLAPQCSTGVVRLEIPEDYPPVPTPDTVVIDAWYPGDASIGGSDAPAMVTDVGRTVDIDVLNNDSDPDRPASVPAPGLTLVGGWSYRWDAYWPGPRTVLDYSANGVRLVYNADGTIRYTPPASFADETGKRWDSFLYTVTDSDGLSADSTVTIRVIHNNAPSVWGENFQGSFEQAVVGSVATNDVEPDGEDLVYGPVAAEAPANGSVTIAADGAFTYMPNAGFGGTDSFTYEVCDDHVLAGGDMAGTPAPRCRHGKAGVTIFNGHPVGAVDNATTAEDVAVDIDVLENDFDSEDTPAGRPLVVTSVDATSVKGGTVVDNGDGTVTYTPAKDFCGNDSFEYWMRDSGDELGRSEVRIVVTCDHPPVAQDDTATTALNTAVDIDYASNDTDIETGAPALASFDATSAEGGAVVDRGDGTFGYTPAADFCGVDVFNYSVIDADGQVDTAAVTVTVKCADRAADTDGNGVPDWQEIAACGEAGCMFDYLRAETVGSCSNTAAFSIPGTLEYDIPGGFRADTDIRIFMFSDPVLLYAGVLPASGTVSLAIPASVTAGAHKFMVIGVDDLTGSVKVDGCVTNGQVPTTSVPETTATSSPALTSAPGAKRPAVAGSKQASAAASAGTKPAVTGARAMPIVIAGWAFVGAGLCVFLLGRRRNRNRVV